MPYAYIHILMAEDNRINHLFAVPLLGKAGHIIEVVSNGHQAVDAVRDGDYDVVLMDIQNAMSGAKKQYLSSGFDCYVTKPVQPAVLLAKLAELPPGKRSNNVIRLPGAA
jgi:CheY-like chemotaxis protein